jgi:hypothetical protein
MKRMPLTAAEAECCCACNHWKPETESVGECHHPKMHCGLGFRNPITGAITVSEHWQTGRYHSCLNFEAK